MLYQLMNKDVVVATYKEREELDGHRYDLVEQLDSYAPYGMCDINTWIDGRQIAKHRLPIEKLIRSLDLVGRHEFIDKVHCLSLIDTFWMKREDEDLAWEDVSLYCNPFNDAIARVSLDDVGVYECGNSLMSPEFATSGSFAKCWIRCENQVALLKRGSIGYANAGFEPYSEALASDLLEAAKIDHVPYSLMKFHGKLACECPLFTSEELGFVAAYKFFNRNFDADDMLELSAKCGTEESFREMIVMDAVMANVDRHSGNYGFLVDNATGEVLRMAPLFDHNMACLPMMMEQDDFEQYVNMIGPKIGTDFIAIARAMMTSSIKAKLIELKDFEYTDPGYDYPKWKLDSVNRLKDRQIALLLE